MKRLLWLLIASSIVVVSCGDDDEAVTESPTATTQPSPDTEPTLAPTGPGGDGSDGGVSSSEFQRLSNRATEIAQSYWGSWPDDSIVERFADDVVFYDPSDCDFTIAGKDRFAPILKGLLRAWSAADPSVEAVFAATDGAAYRVEAPAVIWPPFVPEPEEHPPVVILYVFGFDDDVVTKYELWFEDDTLEMLGFGCFGVQACPEAQATVDRYVAAWASGDPVSIAALYADDATLSDSVLGIESAGADEIGGLFDRRFGPETPIEIVNVYAQTNGYEMPTDSSPDGGSVIGIGIHFRLPSKDSDLPPTEALATFELGTRRSNGFDRHPAGLITREEVFRIVDPQISAECRRDMEAAASVPGLEEELLEHNQELHPTFTSCTSIEEWENAATGAGLGHILDAGFIEGECGFNPGVAGTPLCEAFQVSRD